MVHISKYITQGDLTELLGPVTPYTPRLPLNDPHAFPYLPEDADHPYHLVIVAGQECPGLSGLPMGLGAGFKLSDKEKKRRENREVNDRCELLSIRASRRASEGATHNKEYQYPAPRYYSIQC